jgi:thioredoxin reductase (NADPH)
MLIKLIVAYLRIRIMTQGDDYDLIVIGAGPAGMTAGMFSARSGLKTVVLDKEICGGLSNEAAMIDNYPGFRRISGMELAEKMKEQTAEYAEIKELEGVDKMEVRENEIRVATEKGSYLTSAVVLCTGTKKRKLGVKGENEFLGRGVSYCATCDGFFFKDKSVIVVGGGDSAVRGALYLKNIGCEVTLIHRREELRAEQYLQKNLKKAGVHILWNSVVKEIAGDNVVRSVVRYNKASATEDELEVDGVFIYVGEEPANALAIQMGVTLDENGYIITDKSQRTNRGRVYAAGDITGGVRQIVVACAEGAIAATSAYEDVTR